VISIPDANKVRIIFKKKPVTIFSIIAQKHITTKKGVAFFLYSFVIVRKKGKITDNKKIS